MNDFYKIGRGLAFRQCEEGACSRKEKPPRLSKILTNQVREGGVALPSATVREVFDVSSEYPRDLFDTGSGAVREVFDCCSGGSRRTTEAHPKQYRSCPEPVPKRTRSAPEGHPNSTRRNRWRFCRFLGKLKARIKDRCSKDVVPFTQLLRKIAEVPLMNRECTVSVRGVYRKGTGDLLRSYWRSTTDLLNACTSRVDQQYIKSRGIVGVEAMTNKVTLCLAGLLCFMLFNLSDAWAQSAEPRTAEGQIEIKPLKIGDTIPEELWNLPMQVVNHPTGKDTITLNDYRDKKLIILDFWATWCAPCIAMMPKIDSLQDTYDKNIQFIGATNEGREVVSTFFKRRNKIQDTNRSVVFVTNERLLTQYFPHGSIPHYIWFDSEGKVLALTGTESVNKEIIQKLLNGENLSLMKKEDFHLPLDTKKPFLFKEDALYGGDIIFQRTLTGYIDGAGAGYVQTIDIDDNDSPYIQGPYRRISARNQSIVKLYQLAFSNHNQYFHWHNTEIRSEDKQKLKTESKGAAFVEWMKAGNTFCYELIISEEQKDTAWAIMREDLKRQFPKYTATIERKAVPSLCLVRTSNVDKISSVDSTRVLDVGPFGGRINSYPLAYLIRELNDKGLQAYRKPLIDLTGYRGLVDIEIHAKLTDLRGINDELKKYDLEFVEQDHMVDVLIIDDTHRGAATKDNVK